MADSALSTQIKSTPPDNKASWGTAEAAVEVLKTAIGGGLPAPSTGANPGSDAAQAVAVQGVTGGKAVATKVAGGDNVVEGNTIGAAVTTDANGTIQQYLRGLVKLVAAIISVKIDQTTPGSTNAVQTKQYTGVPSSFTIQTADQTVFTLAAGEKGFIQNLSADAPLAVKKGATASTTSLNFILAASTSASDGTGGAVSIDDWIGVVSVAKMAGTASYLAWKQAP